MPPSGLFYNIGSVAKTFVATLLAQSVVEGKASFRDDVRKYSPGSFPNLQYNGAPIKLVDLANHTSGLPGSLHQYSSAAINLLTGKTLQEQVDFFGAYTSDFLP